MKTKKLEKKLVLRKKTVSRLSMQEVKGGVFTPRCPDTYTAVPCLTWTIAPCTFGQPNCVTNQDSDPCC